MRQPSCSFKRCWDEATLMLPKFHYTLYCDWLLTEDHPSATLATEGTTKCLCFCPTVMFAPTLVTMPSVSVHICCRCITTMYTAYICASQICWISNSSAIVINIGMVIASVGGCEESNGTDFHHMDCAQTDGI